MKNPRVSVIIPNYNHAKYLDQRIQSVLNQTYQDFEVIILDDCSPDNGASRAVIEKYRSNPHISHIVYNEKNSGSTFIQWQKGFSLAKGEIIWIAESDDYSEPNFLSKCVEVIRNRTDIALVFATSLLVDDNGNACKLRDRAEMIPSGVMDGQQFISKYMCTENVIWNASAVIFRKDFALSIPKTYQTYKAAGDHLFWVLLAERGKVAHISDCLNYFRQHQQKVTPTKYREGITYKEEYDTFRYIKSINLVSPAKEKDAFYVYLKQILQQDFDNEEIRSRLLKMWWKENYFKFLRAFYAIKLSLFKTKVISKVHL